MVTIQPVDPAELSPGEFVHPFAKRSNAMRSAVLVIDSLNGYLNAMPGERILDHSTARVADVPRTARRGDAVGVVPIKA